MALADEIAPETKALWESVEAKGYRAPCTQFPQMWDAPDGGVERPAQAAIRVKTAQRFCMNCKVFIQCAEAASAERAPKGVWAGLVFFDRLNTKQFNEKVQALLDRKET